MGLEFISSNLWCFFKKTRLEQVKLDLENCFRACNEIGNIKNSVLSKIIQIIDEKKFHGYKDICYIKQFINIQNKSFYIYGKVLEQF